LRTTVDHKLLVRRVQTRGLRHERVPDENEDGGNFIRVHNSESRARRARAFCIDYVAQLQECDGHVERLDGKLSEWLTCNFVLTDARDKIANDAIRMLERLPAQAVPLPDALTGGVVPGRSSGSMLLSSKHRYNIGFRLEDAPSNKLR